MGTRTQLRFLEQYALPAASRGCGHEQSRFRGERPGSTEERSSILAAFPWCAFWAGPPRLGDRLGSAALSTGGNGRAVPPPSAVIRVPHCGSTTVGLEIPNQVFANKTFHVRLVQLTASEQASRGVSCRFQARLGVDPTDGLQ